MVDKLVDTEREREREEGVGFICYRNNKRVMPSTNDIIAYSSPVITGNTSNVYRAPAGVHTCVF